MNMMMVVIMTMTMMMMMMTCYDDAMMTMPTTRL